MKGNLKQNDPGNITQNKASTDHGQGMRAEVQVDRLQWSCVCAGVNTTQTNRWVVSVSIRWVSMKSDIMNPNAN